MDIKVYNSVKSVKVTKVYISQYSSPSIIVYDFHGEYKFWDAVKQVQSKMDSEVLKVEFIKEYGSDEATAQTLFAFWAYELMTKTVARLEEKFFQHSSGWMKDEHTVNGAIEPVDRAGHDVRGAINDGIRHYNLELAEASEQASKEFWDKVKSMKEGNE